MRLVRMARAHLGVLLLTAGALGGLGLGVRLQPESFPVAAIDLRLLAPDAEPAARRELGSMGWDLRDHLSSVTFVVDTDARNYLERQLGGPLLNDLAREVPVWYWRVRFFRPLQIEEFEARLHPAGRILGLYRVIPEAAPGPYLETEEARRLAELGLAQAGALAGGVWREVSASAERRPARMDHVFVWQRAGFAGAEAQHRLRAVIQGDRFDGYAEFVKVPDEWRRAQSRERNRGFVLAQWGWAATSGLALAAAFALLRDFRGGAVVWRFPLTLGALLLAVGLAAGLNSLPSTLASFSTTQTLDGYLLQRAASTAMEYLPQLGVALLVGAAGVALYRRALPTLLPPEAPLSRLRLRNPQVGQAVLAGYAFSGIWLGYLSLFYLVGQRWFEVWNPVEVPYRDVMSSLVPLLFPLTVGVGAAVSEELMFRFFAIPALLLGLPALLGWGSLDRLGRRRRLLVFGLAILLPALVWGSLHANWPQQPFYVRSIEVAGAGIISGLLLVRFGILATLVNHYVSNAAIVAALFLLSGNAYLQVSGVVAVALPAVVYGLGWAVSAVGRSGPAE